MKIILLSGGAGKRLWPLSSHSRSKQFLQVLQDDSGRQLSMVQTTMEHLKHLGLEGDVIVASTSDQIQQLHMQLGAHIETVIEPERRDTYPAILLCAAYLHAVLHVDQDETVIILPVDHMTDSSFYNMLFQLDKLVQLEQAAIGLIGVRPTEPSSKFGYMVPSTGQAHEPGPGSGSSPLHLIERFVEKPDEQTAISLIAKGALWNCGVFALRLSYLIELIQDLELEADYEWLRSRYSLLPAISFDYAVIENERELMSLVYKGLWWDLGTWDALSQTLEHPLYGRGIVAPNCRDTHIMNELPIPVLVSGIDNAVIVAGDEGILVTAKHTASELKPLIEQTLEEAQQPDRTAEYGWSRTVDRVDKRGQAASITRRMHIRSGQQLCCKETKGETIWIILAGQGLYRAGDEDLSIKEGSTVKPYYNCSYEAAVSTELLEVVLTGT
ncbi:mannose-1-phosphate guanylyltransferase [Paenibacillus oenotherae]|uniref:Mannose-1-phosphate guanylyltransferase n=1 Tax=Paenibacillus oenotherae TaxID=1435645 RepID=A0ABS7D4E0_9BACL|nr:sugar phosphate nucleotidyltransferase [Paenibacillus oenotherae]MBW7474671.1 mannose-1-phosphate guanylyltransferase [Paenibacillus oenotherae]